MNAPLSDALHRVNDLAKSNWHCLERPEDLEQFHLAIRDAIGICSRSPLQEPQEIVQPLLRALKRTRLALYVWAAEQKKRRCLYWDLSGYRVDRHRTALRRIYRKKTGEHDGRFTPLYSAAQYRELEERFKSRIEAIPLGSRQGAKHTDPEIHELMAMSDFLRAEDWDNFLLHVLEYRLAKIEGMAEDLREVWDVSLRQDKECSLPATTASESPKVVLIQQQGPIKIVTDGKSKLQVDKPAIPRGDVHAMMGAAAAHLLKHPGSTLKELAAAIGITSRHLRRLPDVHKVWQTHRAGLEASRDERYRNPHQQLGEGKGPQSNSED